MKLKLPLMLINLKTYQQTSENAEEIAKIAKDISDELNVSIAVAPSHASLERIAKIIPAFSQSMDAYEPGAHTGSMIAEDIRRCGAVGAIINHSERRIPYEDIKKCVEICKANNLISIVCTKDDVESKELAKLNPDFIAIEPPELIGKISVATANPGIVRKSVAAVGGKCRVLCGAGIQTKDDARISIELGTDGVLASSFLIKANSFEEAIREAAEGLK